VAGTTGTSPPELSVDAAARALTGSDLSTETSETIRKRIAEGADEGDPAVLVTGLILGSPEFQRQ